MKCARRFHKRAQSCVYQYSSKQSKAFLVSLVNKLGWIPVKLTQRGVNRHYGKSIHSVVTTVAPYLVMDMIFTSPAMLQSEKKSYSSPGWTYIPSFIAFNPSGCTQSFSAGSFYFQRDEVEVFTEILKGK